MSHSVRESSSLSSLRCDFNNSSTLTLSFKRLDDVFINNTALSLVSPSFINGAVLKVATIALFLPFSAATSSILRRLYRFRQMPKQGSVDASPDQSNCTNLALMISRFGDATLPLSNCSLSALLPCQKRMGHVSWIVVEPSADAGSCWDCCAFVYEPLKNNKTITEKTTEIALVWSPELFTSSASLS